MAGSWGQGGPRAAGASCLAFSAFRQRSSSLLDRKVESSVWPYEVRARLGPSSLSLPFIFTSSQFPSVSVRAKGLPGGRPNPSPASCGQTGSDGFLTGREY